MYNTKFLLEALDSLIESAANKLSQQELELLHTIRDGIAKSSSDEEKEKWFFDLVKWLMLIKEFLDKL